MAAAPTQKVVQQPLVPSDLAEILNGLISNPMNLVKILVQQPSRNRIIECPPCRNHFHVERLWFVIEKKPIYFLNIFSRGFVWVKFDPLLIFQFFQFLFQKWPQWDLANVVRNKVMKNELIWSIHRSSTRDYLHGWAQCAPPRVE